MRYSIVRTLFLSVLLLAASAGAVFGEETVNINTATAEELAAALSGIGQARAEAIVEYREANGRFASVDELTRVSGIGQNTVEANRERILVD
ncbi:MAG: helix-hairpin-helix domain-containing protein [Ectothiorhodospiraceae bacterium]|nr:helix-hairpin-helix domain-containing protein [Ectothiorhodospiraceae bacterium]